MSTHVTHVEGHILLNVLGLGIESPIEGFSIKPE